MSGSLRESVGKKDAKKHRAEGRVPCVLYGGKEEIHFVLDEKMLSKIIFTPDTFFIKLTIDGKEYDCTLKDVQYHPVGDEILHADFLEFAPDKPITISIPLRFSGTAPGLIKGGQLIKKFRKLPVRALPGDMPEAIVVDVSKLDLNGTIHVSDLAEKKFHILEKPERFVVACKTTRLAASTEETEEEAEEAAEGEEEKPEGGEE